MSRICLDTSAYSHFRRGDPAVVETIARAQWVGVPTVTLGELRSGFLLGRRPQENESELREFLAEPIVTVLDIDEPASRQYSEIVAMLRGAGTPVPTNDIWIASVAAREGATVVTYDEHFSLIQRVGSVILARP